jgi:uncharacterized membrane protein YhhN
MSPHGFSVAKAAIMFGLGPLEWLIFSIIALILLWRGLSNFKGPKDPPNWGAERYR